MIQSRMRQCARLPAAVAVRLLFKGWLALLAL